MTAQSSPDAARTSRRPVTAYAQGPISVKWVASTDHKVIGNLYLIARSASS
jgi:hypothetical protein